jgi:hypothetical protein
MPIPGNLLTTAMAVMPHTDIDRAMAAALSLDIPFWPQLPNVSYFEDMYVQASEHFPGILLDTDERRLWFSMDTFIGEFEAHMEAMDDPATFDVSEKFSTVYHRFLGLDLADRPAIRGQLEGPISFGFNVLDQNERPILFDDTIRQFLFEFMAKRVNVQLERLKRMNTNAFMFVDEPGLQFLFSALSGYGERAAKADMDLFFSMIERPRGIHLCGNPDWDFLLGLDMDVVSMDIYTNAEVFSSYARSISRFLNRGGIIVWGIVPTGLDAFEKEHVGSLSRQLEAVWNALSKKGIDKDRLLAQGLIAPATCCLVNPDQGKTVEKAFDTVKRLSRHLQDKYGLG